MAGSLDLDIEELREFETIGQGGFSTVLSAWDVGFQRRVAVKVIASLDDAGLRRFERERAIMGRLSYHPNVIMPFRAGRTKAGAAYLVMELGDGGSLEELVDQRGPIPWREAVGYVLEATAALEHAHSRGIVHRDVKPANILLAGDIPKLTDFGIAALKETTASVMAYTLNHCPPEAFAHGTDTRDERSDLYSMASSLYTLLTGGDAPYDVDGSDSQQAYMFRIISDDVPELPAEIDAPHELRAFLRSALDKDPAGRPQTAATFMAQLRSILGEGPGLGTGSHRIGAVPGAGDPTVQHSPSSAPTVIAPATGGTTGQGSATGPGSATGQGTSAVDTGETIASTGDGPGQTGPGDTGDSGTSTGPHGSTGGDTGDGADGGASTPAVGVLDFPPPATDPVEVVDSSPTPTGDQEQATPTETTPSRRRKLPLVLAALAVILVAGGAAALLLRPQDDGGPPPVAWTFETDSSLASKPAVAEGTLVIGARITNTVHAIDTETGEERWAFSTGDGVDANPVIVDGVVYVGANDGMLHAIDLADGGEVWSTDLGAAVKGTALVRDDTVYVGTSEPAFQALDLASGEVLWSSPIPPNDFFTVEFNSRPVAVTDDGAEVIAAGANDGGLYLYDPATGEELDRIELPGGVWFSGPLVLDTDDGGEELWVGTSVENGGDLNRVTFPGGDVVSFPTEGGVGTDPALSAEGHIVFGNDVGVLYAVDRTTLGEIWREGYAVNTQIKGSPVVVGDQIIFGTHDKELIAVSSIDGTELWRFEGEQIFGLSAPVVVDGALYVGDDSGTVYRFDL